MAKQDQQKQKDKQTSQEDQPAACPDTSRARAATRTPISPLEERSAAAAAPVARLARIPASIRRRQLLIGGLGLTATTLALGGWFWYLASPHSGLFRSASPDQQGDQLVIRWNNATLEAIRTAQSPLPIAARALSLVHTSMFDAWAAYDPTALGTRLGASIRQPAHERTLPNKRQAMSYAAYRTLLDLFPSEGTRFQLLMTSLAYDPTDLNTGTGTPAGIGNLAAQAVLAFRHNDGSNQLGNLLPGAYTDYTHYQPVSTDASTDDPNHWQPLSLPGGLTGEKKQQFSCAQWANVTPFALASALQFVPKPGPPRYPNRQYTNEAQQILQYSAGLNDEQKVMAEYWTVNPQGQILARWFSFAQFISQRDAHTLDQNARLFFCLANAGLDTSIACWATKRTYNSAYPVTAIHYLFKNQSVYAWAGKYRGLQWLAGQDWYPYQPEQSTLPSYPEYCSELSAFSSAAAAILRKFTGSDALGVTYTQPAHSSVIDPATPATPITLSWSSLSQTVVQVGMAGRYSGIHFTRSDTDGRLLGQRVAEQVWNKAQNYINGHAHR